jgi:nitrite reductase (cytochrome c-552)
MPLTYPWGNGLSVENAEQYWDEAKFTDGSTFVDYLHKETKAPILKAQHPEFELWSQGIHARAGVTCSDCHMPYIREGASKVSDHWVRSPLLKINRACQSCHKASESEMAARVDSIQSKNYELLQRGGAAIVSLIDTILEARAAGASEEALDPALKMQRKAPWRLDYIAAENSMGFHAPQEAARILGEAADYARQGEVLALRAAYVPDEEGEEGEPSEESPANEPTKKPAID